MKTARRFAKRIKNAGSLREFHYHKRLQLFMTRLRKACWVALCPGWRIMLISIATWLLFEAATVSQPHKGKIAPQQGAQSLMYSLLCFAALWIASRAQMPEWLEAALAQMPAMLKIPLWRVMFLLMLLSSTWHSINTQFAGAAGGNYRTDAIAFVHADAQLLIEGRNPYTADDAFWSAMRRWPYALATPLLGSKAFGSDPKHYPTSRAMSSLLQYAATHPDARTAHNFDPQTVHNYPAGITWLALPLVWAGLPSVIWLNVIFFLLMIVIVLSRAPASAWVALAIVLVANPTLMLNEMMVNFDISCLFFALAAWNWLPHEKSSTVLLGSACAIKQLAWFMVPFYLLEIWRREGWEAMLRRGCWIAVSFLTINLPFIVMNPGAWLHSILIPMTDPMFPLGFGPITLALGNVIPLGTSHTWLMLMIGMMLALFAFQWLRPAVTSDGILLALIPFWLSWRSSLNYVALLPMLAAWVAITQAAAMKGEGKLLPDKMLQGSSDLPARKDIKEESELESAGVD